MSISELEYISLFKRIGLKDDKAVETAKNAILSKKIYHIVKKMEDNVVKCKVDTEIGVLLYVASSFNFNDSQLDHILQLIHLKKINSGAQIKAASEYFKFNIDDKINISELEKACGINVKYSEQDIESSVVKALTKLKISDPLKINKGFVIGNVTREFKWVEMELLNKIIDKKIAGLAISSGKTDNSASASEKVDVDVPKQNLTDWKSVVEAIDPKRIYCCGEAAKFHKPGENYTSPNYIINDSTQQMMAEHLKKYGNQVRTRFPPEPNGILHIGHAKAINFNFGYAFAHGGITFLRYDDTNPEKEEERYFHGIRDMVEWLGFKPYQITYASDHFDILYIYAQKLIKKNLAYVCHQKPEDVKGRNLPSSPWRERPSSESLQLFEDMKNGKFHEGEAILRLKYEMEDGKTDPVAYRILYTPHHRTGYKWCIYPTYSYTHPICDSIEGITHSCCTKEFQNQRSFYYWLCNVLEIYCPVQWEYSRLNLNYSIVSKRKLIKLIENKAVGDWDDPRLFTLSALKRRGVPREAVNYFCSKVGVTMAQNTINPAVLYSCTREVLNIMASRLMAVLSPLKINILNLEHEIHLKAPKFPFDTSLGHRDLVFGKEIHIDASDFEENLKDNNFWRLTSSQPVGLMHVGKLLKVITVQKDNEGRPVTLNCEIQDVTESNKPKAFIQWVYQGNTCKVKIFNELFLHPNPDEVEGGFLNDINPESLVEIQHCIVERTNEPRDAHYQFERVGYFYQDNDSTPDNLIYNRTIGLK